MEKDDCLDAEVELSDSDGVIGTMTRRQLYALTAFEKIAKAAKVVNKEAWICPEKLKGLWKGLKELKDVIQKYEDEFGEIK